MHQANLRGHQVLVGGRPVCLRTLTPILTDTRLLTLPLLLLHGLGCSCHAWGPALAELAERPVGQNVYAADFPGYGGSRGPSEALGMTELADWTAALMDSLGIRRGHIAGHSMGAQVALEMARRYPERVGGVVLIGPTTGRQRVPYWRYVAGLFMDGSREPLRYNITLARMYAQMGMRRYFATVNKMLADAPLANAGKIDTPCLVLRGQHDGIVPERVARELADTLPRGRFIQVKRSAHALQFDNPKAFLDLAVPFWQEAEVFPPDAATLAAPGEAV